MTMRRAAFAAFLLCFSAPLIAVQPPAAPTVPAATPALDPARLAAAEGLARLLLPEGAMRRFLAHGMPGMDMAMDMTPNDAGIGDMSGLSAADRNRTIGELGAARDPHFRERMQIAQRIIGESFAAMLIDFEPEMRHAYARALARHFTVGEMAEMTTFFSSPTGSKYAEMALTIAQDPYFTETMRALMPRMAQAMRGIDERIRAATAHLPPPPAPDRPRRTERPGHDNS